MAMTRSARKNTKSEPSLTGQKRDRSDYVSDLPDEKPPVVGNNQLISSSPDSPINKVDGSVTTDNDEDDTDVIPPYVYDPPYRKDLVRDERFYFSLVTIQVENCLFRLPLQTLECNSDLCARMFATLEKEGKDLSSKTVAFPWISACKFRLYLEALCPRKGSKLSVDEWLAILYTADYMESTSIRKRAMKILESDPIMSGFPRLEFALSISDVHWYKKSIFELATRVQPLTLAESEKLGMEIVVKINDARSKWRDINPWGPAVKERNKEKELYEYIVKLFKPEIDDLHEK